MLDRASRELIFLLLMSLLMIDALSTGDQQQRRIESFCVAQKLARLGYPINRESVNQNVQ
jgi:hypothetical protein